MPTVILPSLQPRFQQLPPWFKQPIPDKQRIKEMQGLLQDVSLFTVCQGAHCPNIGQCWQRGVATFMILGDTCTRACRFCAVSSGNPKVVDHGEPQRVAFAVKKLNLRYVVVTSVTRDDLTDGGAGHFAKTILAIRKATPLTKIEVLVPDFLGNRKHFKVVNDANPDVISHNIETVARLTKEIRPQADYQRSLEVLAAFKELNTFALIKSGFMVGLGETEREVIELMHDLLDAGCDLLTIGQYLAPSRKHSEVMRFVSPERFEEYRRLGQEIGFKHVLSGPLVRSSYIAEQGYHECHKSNY